MRDICDGLGCGYLQPVFAHAPFFWHGTSEALFEKGLCLPSGAGLSDKNVARTVRTAGSRLRSKTASRQGGQEEGFRIQYRRGCKKYRRPSAFARLRRDKPDRRVSRAQFPAVQQPGGYEEAGRIWTCMLSNGLHDG